MANVNLDRVANALGLNAKQGNTADYHKLGVVKAVGNTLEVLIDGNEESTECAALASVSASVGDRALVLITKAGDGYVLGVF